MKARARLDRLSRMDYRLLGPLEFMDGPEPVTIGGAKSRVLLTRLLIDAGRVVSADSLVEAMWGESPPEKPTGALQVHVSRLRSVVGEGVIVTRPPGYLIRIDPDELDLEVCERLIEEGRRALREDAPGLAADKLRQADRLYRGRPLEGLADEDFARPVAVRFEELRVGAIEDRVEADLALGRHGELIPELEGLVALHPWRERLWGQLMLALYRAGRQADALRVYRQAAETLGEELGLEPGPELRKLEDDILMQRVELSWQPPVASGPESDEVGFLLWEVKGVLDPLTTESVRRAIAEAVRESPGSPMKGLPGASGYVVFQPEQALALALSVGAIIHDAGHDALGVALDVGAFEERNGRATGLALHQCLRLLKTGHAGQILLGAAATDRLSQFLPSEAGLVDLGPHRLPGVTAPVAVHQLQAPGWRTEFPPLRLSAAAATNLPTQLTTFLGRQLELGQVGTLIEDHRLVTLTGPGGAGKTRLALQAAADRVGSHPDGVWLVELAALTEPDQVVKAALEAVGGVEQANREMTGVLTERLQDADALLVFDNCEHLIDATADLVAHLLRSCRGVRVLATSRQALGVPGEWVWPVATLIVPDPDHLRGAEELLRYEAVQLFVERARALRPGFELDQANASAVARICRRVDGLPLAVELAAARIRSLSPLQIADRLDQAVDLLGGGARTALPRHQTLRATLDWSHELLSDQEQVLYRRIGTFQGGCTLDAVTLVCSDPPLSPEEMIDLLDRLIEKSLLMTIDAVAGTRYFMLETIRDHSCSKLEEAGEGPRLTEAHARYFLDFAQQARMPMRGPHRKEWLDRLEADRSNLRLAVSYWAGRAEGLLMAASLSDYWLSRGHLQEGWNTLASLLVANGMLDSVSARARLGAASVAIQLGHLDTAEALLQEALATGEELGDREVTGEAHNGFGVLIARRRNWDESRSEFMLAIADHEAVGDYWWKARALANLGVTLLHSGDVNGSLTVTEQALATFRQLGDDYWVAKLSNNLAVMTHTAGHSSYGLDLVEDAVRLSERLGDRLDLSNHLSTLGEIHLDRDEIDAAADAFRRSLENAYAVGSVWESAGRLVYLAAVAAKKDQWYRAAKLLAAADRAFNAIRVPAPPELDAVRAAVSAEVASHLAAVETERASGAGQAISFDEAVGYALDANRQS